MPPGAHPAHALLSAASALLRPADAISARPLPIEEPLPADDVSDLRDVVDAINKLCDTMKTSYDYDEIEASPAETAAEVDSEVKSGETEATQTVEHMDDAVETWSEPSLAADIAAEMYYSAIAEASLDMWNDSIGVRQEPPRTNDAFYNAMSAMQPRTETLEEQNLVECSLDLAKIGTHHSEVAEIEIEPPKYSTKIAAGPSNLAEIEAGPATATSEIRAGASMDPVEIESDHQKYTSSEHAESHFITSDERRTDNYETEAAAYETTSEMYYTASSEVSLLSDTDLMEKVNDESDKEKSDKNIMAGHVAAMRERFESMTRANTPCPDLVRSLSPSLDMFRNITPSPDFLDKS